MILGIVKNPPTWHTWSERSITINIRRVINRKNNRYRYSRTGTEGQKITSMVVS